MLPSRWMRILGRSSTLHPGFRAPVRAQKHPSWPWARLASFHRWSCRGTPSSAIALTRFFVSTAHAARSIRSGLWSPDLTRVSVLLSAPPSGFDHPLGGSIPIVPCAAAFTARSAREIHPSELSLDQNGTGFPASALLRFLGGVPYARCGSVSGLRFPVEVPRGPGSTFRFSLGFSLWGLLRRPGCRFDFPVPSSCALSVRDALRRHARGALECCVATQSTSLAARQPLWALRPCGHAGSSPRITVTP
jgi:hypothetical protein